MLDLTKILKDCPKGTKLYSIVHGVVTFEEILKEEYIYPIIIKCKDDVRHQLDSNDKYIYSLDGECILFPSKDNRDWSTFKVEKPKFDVNCLRPFDKVLVRDADKEQWTAAIFSHVGPANENYNFVASSVSWIQCIPYNEATAKLLGTTDPAPEYYKNW